MSLLELPLGLTLQNWPFIIFDTGAISESTALAHSGIIISKLGLCFAPEGGHADNNNASRVFFLYCNATYALYMSPGTPLKPSRVWCQGCLPSQTACMKRAGKSREKIGRNAKENKKKLKKNSWGKKSRILIQNYVF